MKEKIEKWYRQGLWTSEMIMNAVEKGALMKEEADQIIKSYNERND